MERTLSSRSSSGGSQPGTRVHTPSSPRRTLSTTSSGGLPSPPNLLQAPRRGNSGMVSPPIPQSQLAQNMAKSMTIDQMRELHQRALSEADAKRTELRLVLASRYRELVGSSDEVIKMKERSQELYDLVHALPQLIEKVSRGTIPGTIADDEEGKDEAAEEGKPIEPKTHEDHAAVRLRRDLSLLPRVIHRALDAKDVHKATVSLIQLFTLIASQTNVYPLANALATTVPAEPNPQIDPTLEAQMRMIFLQVQTVPEKVRRISTKILARSACYGNNIEDPARGAIKSAAALASLNLLETDNAHDRVERLLSTYFEAKAKLLVSLLGKLTTEEGPGTVNAEDILSKIVLILQHDIVIHPYQIFIIRKFPGDEEDHITNTLPLFEREAVKSKCSKYVQCCVAVSLLRSCVSFYKRSTFDFPGFWLLICP